ncbi:MAG: linear amide C-N hydrolase [Clostridia bacterium]|nr:linear amide C-N hydrolase [Clostridia bacterium]
MKKRIICLCLCVALLILPACSGKEGGNETSSSSAAPSSSSAVSETQTTTEKATETESVTQTSSAGETRAAKKTAPLNTVKITPSQAIKNLLPGFSYAEYRGDDGLSDFLSGGGVSNDDELTSFLVKQVVFSGRAGPIFRFKGAGCSTLSVRSKSGGYLFGRNFDWKRCNGLALVCRPSSGYKSVSTVNTDFITSNSDFKLTDDMLRFCALYAPLDGMNEKGVCVSVNMVFDKSASINQQTSKPDLTTSTAIRLILDRAASAKQAVELLKKYDMHASFGYVIHFAISDSTGYSVAVEYINNKLTVTETPVLTNFYVTPSKYGIGSQKSVKRYELIMDALEETPEMSAAQVRDVMADAAQSQLADYSTEWTAVFDRSTKSVTYYHRGGFKKGYTVYL